MSKLREAAQQVLEFCEFLWRDVPLNDYSEDMRQDVEAALRAALAEPTGKPSLQVEPVAWRYKKEGGGWYVSDNEPQYVEQWNDIEEIVPLYTHPAPQRQPLPKHDQHCVDVPGYGLMATKLVRAVERAHGIGGQDDTR